MEKKLPIISAVGFCGLTIFQIAFFCKSELIKKTFEPVDHMMKYFLWPGIIICFFLPWSPDLYATYPRLLAFPRAVNSFLYSGLLICLFLLVKKLRIQPRSL